MQDAMDVSEQEKNVQEDADHGILISYITISFSSLSGVSDMQYSRTEGTRREIRLALTPQSGKTRSKTLVSWTPSGDDC